MKDLIEKRIYLGELRNLNYNTIGEFKENLALVSINKHDLSDNLYGFIDENLNEKIKPEYIEATSFSEGLSAVRKANSKEFIYIDKNNKVILSGNYEKAYPFKDGLAKVIINKKEVFINKDGEIVIKPKYKTDNEFRDGMIRIYKLKSVFDINKGRQFHYLVGYMNKNGEVVVKPKYLNTSGEFCEGLAYVKSSKNKEYFIDKNGDEVIKQKRSKRNLYNLQFKEGLAVINNTSKSYYIDKTGKKVFEKDFDDADIFSEGLAPVKVNNKWGFINKSGILVIDAKYDSVSKFKLGHAIVSIRGKNTFIDKTGKELSDFIYSSAIILNDRYVYLYTKDIILDLKNTIYEVSIRVNDNIKKMTFNSEKGADDFIDNIKDYVYNETIRKNEEINNYVLPLIKKARKDEYLINKRYEDDMINKINDYYKKGFRK